MFVDLSELIKSAFVFLILLVPLLNFDMNLFRIGLNSMFLIILCKSNSNGPSSSIVSRHFGDFKPKVCFPSDFNFLKICNAFHLIGFVTLSSFDINCVIYSVSNGIAIFFWVIDVWSLHVCVKLKLLNSAEPCGSFNYVNM